MFSPPGLWLPGLFGFPLLGQSYVDPVFGSTITRLSADFPQLGTSDIYARNGFWNADGTRVHWRSQNGCTIRNSLTGAATQSSGVPCSFHVQFDPSRANKLFYYSGASLREYDIVTGTTALVKTFPSTLQTLGGSVDYTDHSGRYFVVAYGGGVHVWDKAEDAIYTGATPSGIGSGGWTGPSPDGAYLVVADGSFYAYTLNHAANTIGPQRFLWNLCGDHGDLATASNGLSYLVTFECSALSAVFSIQLAINNNGKESNGAAQRASGIQLLNTDGQDEGHFSCAGNDWCWFSVESGDDDFLNQGQWRPFKSEILAMNVLTAEVRRFAHHRSRSVDAGYYNGPRVSAMWDGSKAMWASNYGFDAGGLGYSDLYTTTITGGPPSPMLIQPVAWTSFVNSTAWVGKLRKTGGGNGIADSASLSGQSILYGDGYCEMRNPKAALLSYFGFGVGNAGTSTGDIRFGFRLENNVAEVRESNVLKATTSLDVGDTLRVSVTGNEVRYSKNGVMFYTSKNAPTYPLFVDSALLATAAEIDGAVIAGQLAAGGSSPNTSVANGSRRTPARGGMAQRAARGETQPRGGNSELFSVDAGYQQDVSFAQQILTWALGLLDQTGPDATAVVLFADPISDLEGTPLSVGSVAANGLSSEYDVALSSLPPGTYKITAYAHGHSITTYEIGAMTIVIQ